MILLNDFFRIENVQHSNSEVNATVIINAKHKIFEGHFPNQPVVPGVCMLQMIKEILEQVFGYATNLPAAADLKFLAIIDPTQNNRVQATIKYTLGENGLINLTAIIYKDELAHFKCKAQLQITN